jgi:hypothetical protein
LQIEAFQCACTERLEIASFGKDNFVDGLRFVDPENGIAHRARNDLPVCHLKREILFAPLDADALKHRRVDPRGLGASVNHQAPHYRRFRVHRIDEPATDVEKSHVSEW